MTLLEKAKEAKAPMTLKQSTKEEAELALALIKGDITGTQYIIALGSSSENCCQKAYSAIKRAIRDGFIEIKLKRTK